MSTDRRSDDHESRARRELEQRMRTIEPKRRLEPPSDLLAAIRSEIPERLAGGTTTGSDDVGAQEPWWRRHRLALAAALVVLAATGWMSARLDRLVSPERLAERGVSASEGVAAKSAANERTESSDAPQADRDLGASGDAGVAAPAVGNDPEPAPAALREQNIREQTVREQTVRQRAVREKPAVEEPVLDDRATASADPRSNQRSAGTRNEELAPTTLRDGVAEDDSRGVAENAPPPAAGERDERRARVLGEVRSAQREGGASTEPESAPPPPPRATALPRRVEAPEAPSLAREQQARRSASARAYRGDQGVDELKKQQEQVLGDELAELEIGADAGRSGSPASASPAAAADVAAPTHRDSATRSADAVRDGRFDAMEFSAAPVSPFVDPAEDPLSTFGLDVDTGSYTLARRYLELGRLPPVESVRVEEYVNFFDYGDPPPRRGDFALHLEAGPSAFAPDGTERLVLRIGVRARDVAERDRKPVALIFLVDVSGSMQRENRLELVKRSLELLIDELGPEDAVGLVVYGSRGRALLEPTRDHDAIRQAIARLTPEGSTHLEEGLGIAYEMASRFRPAIPSTELVRRVVLCSDGVANVGVTDPEALLRGVADWAQRGVELTAVGFGMGNYDDQLMERLADRGDGTYHYVDSLREARRIFVENLTGTLQTVAADARIQVELDPEAVARYRLLGYANRALPDQAFRDERVDAGEVGAGHRVSALYEIELARGAARDDVLATARLRWRSKESGRTEEIEQRIQVRDALRSWGATTPALRLAQVVAGFAELLGGSPHSEATFERLFREGQAVLPDFPGRLDVARLVSEIEKARDLEAMGGAR